MTELTLFRSENTENLSFKPGEIVEDSEFQGFDFHSIDLKSVSFVGCKFTSCSFANVNFVNVALRDVSFEECNLVGISWSSLKNLGSPNFKSCKLNYSSFQSMKLKKLFMIDCMAIDVDFSNADLSNSDFSGTTLTGANFDRANLTSADFRGSKDYFFDLRSVKSKDVKVNYPECLSLITAFGVIVD
jgi:fluoroquinolone resistance protein